MAHSLQVQFEKVVDWFAMQLGDEEKKRLVTIYHLPRKYLDEYPIIVFQGLKMTGVFGYENPEGLLDIAELLDRMDLFESTKPKLKELKNQKGLRKTSTVVDLKMLYSAVDIGPALEIAMKQIEVAQASSELLQRICKYRFKDEKEKKSILCCRLDQTIKKLSEAGDLLTLMGEDAVGSPAQHPLLTEHIKENISILNGSHHASAFTNEQNSVHPKITVNDSHIYEDVSVPMQIKKEKNAAEIPTLKVTVSNTPAQQKSSSPPRPLPKPGLGQTNASAQKQHHVTLDTEGYALPSTFTLPVKQTPTPETSGSGDSGIEEWPGVLKSIKRTTYQPLLHKDKTNKETTNYMPPTPPPKPKLHPAKK